MSNGTNSENKSKGVGRDGCKCRAEEPDRDSGADTTRLARSHIQYKRDKKRVLDALNDELLTPEEVDEAIKGGDWRGFKGDVPAILAALRVPRTAYGVTCELMRGTTHTKGEFSNKAAAVGTELSHLARTHCSGERAKLPFRVGQLGEVRSPNPRFHGDVWLYGLVWRSERAGHQAQHPALSSLEDTGTKPMGSSDASDGCKDGLYATVIAYDGHKGHVGPSDPPQPKVVADDPKEYVFVRTPDLELGIVKDYRRDRHTLMVYDPVRDMHPQAYPKEQVTILSSARAISGSEREGTTNNDPSIHK